MNIEFYQGDGQEGPYGYCKGIYVNWFLDEGKLDFSLEEDFDWDEEEFGEMAEKCELESNLRDWISEQEQTPNPHVFNRIIQECRKVFE